MEILTSPYFLLAILIVYFIGYNLYIRKYRAPIINSNDIPALIKSNPDLTIVDVRDPHEFMQSHIKGAINIPLREIKSTAHLRINGIDNVILVNCASGVRSRRGAMILVKLGYKQVYDIGGINSYKGKKVYARI